MSTRVLLLSLVMLVAACRGAIAHEMTMAEMEVRQLSATEFTWQWAATEKRPASDELTPRWPEGCSTQENLVRCTNGLQGTLAVEGVGKRFSAAMIKVFWMGGDVRVYTITAGRPTVQLFGSSEDRRGIGEIAGTYVGLGIEHILTGFDHLLFVISLLFLVGFNRRLLWTLTAFTGAHSVTLALSALGLLVLRSAPVEATIALSIMLVASEALHDRKTLSRRWPALVALLFGLVHGLGFAGALQEIGLPQQYRSAALLTFNVGVELGQLLVVAAAFGAYRLAAHWPRSMALRVPALYGIGSVAAFWSMGRLVVMFAR